MDIVLNSSLEPGRDYGFLELAPDAGAWPEDGRGRSLLVSFNTPGYYSLAVRILALTAHRSPTVNGSWDTRYVEADITEDPANLAAAITAWRPDVVAFTVNIWNLQRCLDLIPVLKQALSGSAIVLGGQEVTNSVTDFLAEHRAIDFIIDGEGEIPFLELLAAWDRSSRSLADTMAVSGLRYRRDGSTAFTGPARLVEDLDSLPSPVLAGLVPVRTKNKLGVMLEGARGCPYQCSFCFEGSRVTKVRMASIERLSAEAHFMADRGATYFHLMDPILCNSKPERLKGIADLFKDLNRGRKMQISLETYAQHIHDGIAPYLADFTIIDVGLQSINPDTQKEIRRNFSSERFRAGLASLRQVNPNFNLYLICGLPHETLRTFLEGIEFIIAERPMRIFINELCLLNGTELRRRAADYGYEFDPAPPYRVHASRWMGRREMRFANVLSNLLFRRYNHSLPALLPTAPWMSRQWRPAALPLTIDLSSAGGTADVDAAGADVEVLAAAPADAPLVLRTLGQLQLMGAQRLKLTAPLDAFADPRVVERLAGLGVLQVKTYLTAANAAGLPNLANLARSFSMKGYASIRPVSELVVLRDNEDLPGYLKLLDAAFRSDAEVVTVPRSIDGLGSDWRRLLAGLFRDRVQAGKWMKAPPGVAAEALADLSERDAVVELLGRLELLSGDEGREPGR